MFPVTLLVFSILPSLSMLKYICLFLSMSAYVCVKEREREWWGRRMPFCYIWKSFLLGDSTRFGLYQLVIAKTKPLRFPPSWLLSKHLEERQKKMKRETKSPSPLSLLLLAGSQSLFCWDGGATWNRSVLVHFIFYMSGSSHRHSERYYERLRFIYLFLLSSIMWFCDNTIK